MIKKINIFLTFILCLFSVNAIIFENVPNTCKSQIINNTAYNDFKSTHSFYNITSLLIQDIINSNFTITKSFKIINLQENINLELIFDNDVSVPNNFGDYIPYSKQSRIHIKSIKDYADSKFYVQEDFLKLVNSVILHEITHYLDLDSIGFENVSYTFNLEGTRDNLINTQYYIDLYNDSYIVPQIDLILRYKIDFIEVFNIYSSNEYYDEVIARINSVCLGEVQNGIFDYDYVLKPHYCYNFNFNFQDAHSFNIIIDNIMAQYFFDTYPEKRIDVLKVDEDVCFEYLDLNIMVELGRGLSNFINYVTLPIFNLLIAFVVISGVLSLIYGINKTIIKK